MPRHATAPPLAIVDSPFQLLSLYEALASGAVATQPDVVIRASEGSIQELLDLGRGELADVVQGPMFYTDGLRRLAGRRDLVIGDPFSGLFHTALGVRWRFLQRVVLLDDGASALRLHELLASGRPLTRAHSRRATKSALARFGGWRLRRLARRGRVVLSTGLPMSSVVTGCLAHRGIDIRHHRFEWSASVTIEPPPEAAGQRGDVHVVLGSSLTSDRMLTSEYYRSWLTTTLQEGSLFVPHRREPDGSRELADRAGAHTVGDNPLPVELLLRDVGPALHVDCLPTTAAITLPLIRGERPTSVRCTRPPESAWFRDEIEMRRLVEAIHDADHDDSSSGHDA